MIIDDKFLLCPPPPYESSPTPSIYVPQTPTPNNSIANKPTLHSLPPHILIQIIYATFPADSAQPTKANASPVSTSHAAHSANVGRYNGYDIRLYEDTKAEKQRKVLLWLSTSLRLVCRHLYIACMHVLRSTYLPSYQSLIRPPYSSDPFPSGVPISSPSAEVTIPAEQGFTFHGSTSSLSVSGTVAGSITSLQRETVILDRYITLKIIQDVFADDSEFHIERHDAFRDLFDVAQPRARLEDLVRLYGIREGVISVPGLKKGRIRTPTPRSPSSPSMSSDQLQQTIRSPKPPRTLFSFMRKSSIPPPVIPTPLPPPKPPIQPLLFSLLTVTFSPRKVGLIYNRTRTIAEVQRGSTPSERRSETLESLARALVMGLRDYLEGN